MEALHASHSSSWGGTALAGLRLWSTLVCAAMAGSLQVKGFLGESYLIQDWPGVQDISQHTGWRAFLASKSSS